MTIMQQIDRLEEMIERDKIKLRPVIREYVTKVKWHCPTCMVDYKQSESVLSYCPYCGDKIIDY